MLPNLDTLQLPGGRGVRSRLLTLDFDAGGGLHAAQTIVGLATIRARRQLAGLEQGQAAVGQQLELGRGLGQLATIDEPLYVWLWPAAGSAIEQHVPGPMQCHNLVLRLLNETRWRWCRVRIRSPHLIAAGVLHVTMQAVQTVVGIAANQHAYRLRLDLAHFIARNALVDANVIWGDAVDAQCAVRQDQHVRRQLHTDFVGVLHPDELRSGLANHLAGHVHGVTFAGMHILWTNQQLRLGYV